MKKKAKNNTEPTTNTDPAIETPNKAGQGREKGGLNALERTLQEKGNNYFWNGNSESSPVSHDFRPENRNPEYSPISTTVGFTFFGNQGSVQLEEVYYRVRQSLKSLQKFKSVD